VSEIKEENTMKYYVISWGNAWLNNEGSAGCFSGTYGIYTDKHSAVQGLIECKDKFVKEFIEEAIDDENATPDEQQEALEYLNLEVYGSIKDKYFEIDYSACDSRNEMYINLEEVSVNSDNSKEEA
jgi:hypothetical protein